MLVLEIDPQSAAQQASLLPGDLLLSAAGRPFRTAEDLPDALDSAPGGRLELEFRRGGSRQIRKVVAQVAVEPVRAA